MILMDKKIYTETYFQTFESLKKILDVEEEFIIQISKTASFRNNIVHNYEDEKTQVNLKKNVEPILYLYKKYVQIIKKYIK